MSYETQYYHDKGTTGPTGDRGEKGDTGDKGATGKQTTQKVATIRNTTVETATLKFTTSADGSGTVLGTGSLTRIRVVGTSDYIYKLSATIPTNEPPTIENNGYVERYYARLDSNWYDISMGSDRASDDGLAIFYFNMIHRFGYSALQIYYYGSGGNGVINTILQ